MSTPFSYMNTPKENSVDKFKFLTLTSRPLSEEEFETTAGMKKFNPYTKLHDLFFVLMDAVCTNLGRQTKGRYSFMVFDNGDTSKTIVFDEKAKAKLMETIGQFIQFNNDTTKTTTLKDSLFEKVFCSPVLVNGKNCYFNFNLDIFAKTIEGDIRNTIHNFIPSYPVRQDDERVDEVIEILLSAYSEIFKEVRLAYKLIKKNNVSQEYFPQPYSTPRTI